MATTTRRRKGRKLPPKIKDLREHGRPNARKPYYAYWWNAFSTPPRKGGHKSFETLREAEKWIQDEERDNAAFYQRGEGPKVKSRAFGDVAETWHGRLTKATNTIASYRTHVRGLIRHFGYDTPVAAIDKDDVETWLHHALKVQKLTNGSVKGRLNVLNQIMDAALDRKLRMDNPCRGIRRPAEHEHVAYIFTWDEIIRVMSHLPERYKAPVLLAYHGGLRIGEVCGLRARNLDLVRGYVTITHVRLDDGSVQDHAKGGKRGDVADLPDEALPVFRRHVEQFPPLPDGSVFSKPLDGKGNVPLTQDRLRREFKKACAAAGLPVDEIRFHDLRHTCATNYAEKDAPAYVIQAQLRHGRLDTSQRYIDKVKDESRKNWANIVGSRDAGTISAA